MEAFAKIIYEQWQKANMERDLFFKKGEELVEELQKILSFELSEKIYSTFCDSCFEIEENAFIEGFAYACRCLSDGKVVLKGGDDDE